MQGAGLAWLIAVEQGDRVTFALQGVCRGKADRTASDNDDASHQST
jgi:hypothetical protein